MYGNGFRYIRKWHDINPFVAFYGKIGVYRSVCRSEQGEALQVVPMLGAETSIP